MCSAAAESAESRPSTESGGECFPNPDQTGRAKAKKIERNQQAQEEWIF